MTAVQQQTKPRTKREQRDESIEKLLMAARELFVFKGYRSTTLEQIASAVGLTKGAVYFHFGSKEAVLVRLLDRVEKDLIIPVVQTLQGGRGSEWTRIDQFTRVHGTMGITNPEDILLLISMSIEFAQQQGEAADRIRSIYRLLYDPLEALIRRGQLAGRIRNDVPATELASIIIATHDGAFLEWHRRGNQLDGRNLVRAVLTVLLHGLDNVAAGTEGEGDAKVGT